MSTESHHPYPYSHHIEGYGLHGPTADGLLIAQDIVERVLSEESDPIRIESKIMREIARAFDRVAK